MLMGAAAQFFCNEINDDVEGSTDSTSPYDNCVFRDDTNVFLEMTTRDMLDSGDLLDWTSDIGNDFFIIFKYLFIF